MHDFLNAVAGPGANLLLGGLTYLIWDLQFSNFVGVIAISLLPELVSGALARAKLPLGVRQVWAPRPAPALRFAGEAS